ncbi:hypothetical protein K6119_13505 [Paracrocinitomix mangrovi]|uniref:hypothetical protein n=1 Tax=Paracrocinitomix mangrovi TaxID=2862509 RepID=UPI001C8E23A9|nr:hypothetical protein [Paracrocinitomix mangrovi]UKN00748.1 hypothetical protein K6119_13505 [Paracrocinitomix mangrovi]
MKQLFIILTLGILASTTYAQDTTYWEHTWDYEAGESETIERDWGREVVTYLGTIEWKSPSGKILHIRIITSYQQITRANGFNDRSLVALVKTDHDLIKNYDFVSRQNLPIRIEDNKLVYKTSDGEITAALPTKFAARFCVPDLNCFSEFIL